MLNNIGIRAIREEYGLLEEFLYDAIYQPNGESVIYQKELAIYIKGFGKKDDFCLVAETKEMTIGAVWIRILSGEIKGYGNIDAVTPELITRKF